MYWKTLWYALIKPISRRWKQYLLKTEPIWIKSGSIPLSESIRKRTNLIDETGPIRIDSKQVLCPRKFCFRKLFRIQPPRTYDLQTTSSANMWSTWHIKTSANIYVHFKIQSYQYLSSQNQLINLLCNIHTSHCSKH